MKTVSYHFFAGIVKTGTWPIKVTESSHQVVHMFNWLFSRLRFNSMTGIYAGERVCAHHPSKQIQSYNSAPCYRFIRMHSKYWVLNWMKLLKKNWIYWQSTTFETYLKCIYRPLFFYLTESFHNLVSTIKSIHFSWRSTRMLSDIAMYIIKSVSVTTQINQ